MVRECMEKGSVHDMCMDGYVFGDGVMGMCTGIVVSVYIEDHSYVCCCVRIVVHSCMVMGRGV